MGAERRLVFSSVGDHHRLLIDPTTGSFDVVVSFYGDDPNVRQGLIDRGFVVHDHKGAKFPNLLALHLAHPDLLDAYAAVLVIDDDLALSNSDVVELFDLRERFDLWVVSPSMDPRGRVSYAITEQHLMTSVRFTNFVEMNAPLFKREALQRFLQVYDGSLVGYGTEFWFLSVLDAGTALRYAISDTVMCLNPIDRRETGRREIELVASQSEREAQWRDVSQTRGVERVAPQLLLEARRPFLDVLRVGPGLIYRRGAALRAGVSEHGWEPWITRAASRLGLGSVARRALSSIQRP